MFAKIYLVIVGLLYLGLALWCTFSPAQTSEKIGFELKGGSGRSEFLTVYGGLEFGLAIAFILAALKPDMLTYGLITCLIIHVSLVVFRSIGFVWLSDIEPMTYKLAVGEWIIMLLGFAALYSRKL